MIDERELELQQLAQITDDAWSLELRRMFGKKAGDVRYTDAGHGQPGSRLRQLYDARKSAQRSWLLAVQDRWKAVQP